jgi:hypothetical protein
MDSDKFLKAIRLLVRKEVNSIIKEKVEAEVNKILAEKFVTTMTSGQRNLSEVFSIQEEGSKKTAAAKPNPGKVSETRRKEILKKMGVDGNPLFEDVSLDKNLTDDEDEGIDLSHFGL